MGKMYKKYYCCSTLLNTDIYYLFMMAIMMFDLCLKSQMVTTVSVRRKV